VTDAPSHPIAARFAQIMAALRAAVAIAAGPPPLAGPLVLRARWPLAPKLAVRLHQRLGKMMQAFAALVAQLTAFGADAPPRAPRKKPGPHPDAAAAPAADAAPAPPPDPFRNGPRDTQGATAARPASPPRPARLPGHVGWLAGLSGETAAAASQLRHLLTDPESLALLRASPALVQMLGPLCRMLGVALPAEVLPPPAPAAPDADVAAKPPRRRRRRLWRPPSRRSDMLFLLRMGTPLIET
jgi:hypothetical protein